MAETVRQVSTCSDCRFFGTVACLLAETTITPNHQTTRVKGLETAVKPGRRALLGFEATINYGRAGLEQDTGQNAVGYVADQIEACAAEQRGAWTTSGSTGLGSGRMQSGVPHCSALETSDSRDSRQPGVTLVREIHQSVPPQTLPSES